MHWILLQRLGFNLWARAILFFGPSMRVLTGEIVSSGLLSFGYAESALTALMIETVKPGMSFIDVGAHLGYESILAATLVGRHGHVIAFEPQPKIAEMARRNLSSFPQVRIVQSAVGEKCGATHVEDKGLTGSAFSGRSVNDIGIRVPLVRLDAAIEPGERPVHIIKCDTEGGEVSVLEGAMTLLREDMPLIILEAEMPECDQARPRIAEFEALLAPLGYKAFLFDFDGEFFVGEKGGFVPGHANVGFAPPVWMERVSRFG
jgi:FkbM family methyltransferase